MGREREGPCLTEWEHKRETIETNSCHTDYIPSGQDAAAEKDLQANQNHIAIREIAGLESQNKNEQNETRGSFIDGVTRKKSAGNQVAGVCWLLHWASDRC